MRILLVLLQKGFPPANWGRKNERKTDQKSTIFVSQKYCFRGADFLSGVARLAMRAERTRRSNTDEFVYTRQRVGLKYPDSFSVYQVPWKD